MLALLMLGIITACSDKNDDGKIEGVPTWVSLSINLPSGKTRVSDGEYVGKDAIETLDVYMKSGGVVERAKRFTGSDIAVSGSNVSTTEPFRTTSGHKEIFVVINDVDELGTVEMMENGTMETTGLAQVKTIDGVDYDVITMTGKTSQYLDPDVTSQDVITNKVNKVEVDVTRLASRVIVTLDENANNELENAIGQKIGTISRSSVTYSVAQGTKQIYWLQDINKANYTTWGYDYLPVYGEYVGYADKYYDYSDLHSPEPVVNKPPASDGYKALKGKFLYENMHEEGSETSTKYRKGNTAYVLVRAKFTPYPAAIVDGGELSASGTFYVGQSDGQIYSSKRKAQEALSNQKVATYVDGITMQFAWLNPDNVLKPYNSPVIKNSIYHINITGFKRLGHNWNPLFPEDPDTTSPLNPDPKPGPDEPDSPIYPEDPLSIEETYMSVDISVLDWSVYSYDVEL